MVCLHFSKWNGICLHLFGSPFGLAGTELEPHVVVLGLLNVALLTCATSCYDKLRDEEHHDAKIHETPHLSTSLAYNMESPKQVIGAMYIIHIYIYIYISLYIHI